MMGGWYEMAPGAEKLLRARRSEAMYPHFETSGEWSGIDPLALAQVVSPSDQGFHGWPDVEGFSRKYRPRSSRSITSIPIRTRGGPEEKSDD